MSEEGRVPKQPPPNVTEIRGEEWGIGLRLAWALLWFVASAAAVAWLVG